jgi:hypothetical protein
MASRKNAVRYEMKQKRRAEQKRRRDMERGQTRPLRPFEALVSRLTSRTVEAVEV